MNASEATLPLRRVGRLRRLEKPPTQIERQKGSLCFEPGAIFLEDMDDRDGFFSTKLCWPLACEASRERAELLQGNLDYV